MYFDYLQLQTSENLETYPSSHKFECNQLMCSLLHNGLMSNIQIQQVENTPDGSFVVEVVFLLQIRKWRYIIIWSFNRYSITNTFCRGRCLHGCFVGLLICLVFKFPSSSRFPYLCQGRLFFMETTVDYYELHRTRARAL